MIDRGERAATWLLAALLGVAVVAGGGPRGAGDALVHAVALPCFALGLWRWRWNGAGRWQRAFAVLFATITAVILLQLVPLPPQMFAALPQRAGIAADLASAGIAPAWRPMTLDIAGTLRALLAFLVFATAWLAASTLSMQSRLRVLRVVLIVGVATALFGFAQAGALGGDALRLYDYHHPIGAIGTFANRNHFADLMGVLAPLALAVSVDAHARGQRPLAWAWAGAAIVLVAAAALSYSRAGFALTLAALLVSVPVLARQQARRARWLIPLLVVAFAAVLVGVYAWDGLAKRIAQDPLDDLRWQYLRHAPEAVRQYLPWGSGLGSFRWVYAAVEPLSVMTSTYAGHAHNDLMQVAVEAGIPGLMLLIAFIVLTAIGTLRNLPMGDAGHSVKNVVTGVVAVVAWVPLLHSLVDYPLRTLAIAALLGFLLAWIATPRDPRRG